MIFTTTPKAAPSPSALSFSVITRTYEPRSIGTDGAVYCREASAGNPNRILRTTDGFATVETGADFASASPETLMWCTRTSAGYVAITDSDANDTATIWFSASFGSGFSAVQTLRGVSLISISRPVQTQAGATVLLVGEYMNNVYPSSASKLWGSFDGGQTWSTLKTQTPVSTSVNNHWHNACFDPWSGRIWASGGDGVNSFFGYTDNQGSSWTQVDIPSDSVAYDGNPQMQPTVVIPFRHRIAVTPDRGPLRTGIWHVDKNTGTVVPAAQAAAIQTHLQYGVSAYAQSGDVCYVTYPPTGSGSERLYGLATGDGGRSWWPVIDYSLGASGAASTGIVGPDGLGKLYVKAYLPTSSILIADQLTWVHGR